MIGKTFAHYRVLEPLGAGGMGEVYRARATRLDRDVALKVLPPEVVGDEVARARLMREARLASSLNHPHICTVHEVGEAEGQTYIAMELVAGQLLSERIGTHGLPAETVARLGAQIADALARAHGQGVIHRDLKTSNVMVTPEGRVKVLDFGIAKRAWERSGDTLPTELTLTATGVVVGSPQYLAPELLRGDPADARSDLWALGVVLHEMASGALPFRGNTAFELSSAILNAMPAVLPPTLPAGLRAIVQRCLAKDPAQRYQHAVEVRAALEAVLGDRPSGRASVSAGRAAVAVRAATRGARAWLAPAAGLLALLGLLVALDVGGIRGRLFRGASPNRIQSLAVLPLENLSRDPEQEYFADGMTEELITSLAGLEGVRVISRTSAMHFKGSHQTVPQIARALGADAVIEGSAMRDGGRVRITAQLIEARSDRHLWAKSYERDLKDVLALQDEVAHAIAVEIRASLTPQGRARAGATRVVNPEAHELYLRGRELWNRRTKEAVERAVGYFERAVRLDPHDALAWAGLSDASSIMGSFSFVRPDQAYPRARTAALRALELDPLSAEAHAALANVAFDFDWNWKTAEAEDRRALELNPSYASAHQWYGLRLSLLGRQQEGMDQALQAQRLDPLSPQIAVGVFRRLAEARRFQESVETAKRAIEFDPGFANAHRYLSETYLMMGHYEEAILEQGRSDSLNGRPPEEAWSLRAAYQAAGQRGYWRQRLALARRAARELVPATEIALCDAQLGERDQAFEWLDRAEKDREGALLWLKVLAQWDPLRPDPRFGALLKRIGLPA